MWNTKARKSRYENYGKLSMKIFENKKGNNERESVYAWEESWVSSKSSGAYWFLVRSGVTLQGLVRRWCFNLRSLINIDKYKTNICIYNPILKNQNIKKYCSILPNNFSIYYKFNLVDCVYSNKRCWLYDRVFY